MVVIVPVVAIKEAITNAIVAIKVATEVKLQKLAAAIMLATRVMQSAFSIQWELKVASAMEETSRCLGEVHNNVDMSQEYKYTCELF